MFWWKVSNLRFSIDIHIRVHIGVHIRFIRLIPTNLNVARSSKLFAEKDFLFRFIWCNVGKAGKVGNKWHSAFKFECR